MNVKLA